MIVFDTVYNPESTLLLEGSPLARLPHRDRRRDVHPPGGAAVLLFTGKEAPEPLMRETLKRAIGPVKY